MEDKAQIIHDFNESKSSSETHKRDLNMGKAKPPFILFLILILLGVATGYVVAQVGGSKAIQVEGPNGETQTVGVSQGQTFGSTDEKTFKDSAEGTLREGGIEGEGAYHLERPGGESQNVYLTSSVIDLSKFVGKKVKVWGETNAAERAGWLMDVGRLQVL